MTARKMPAIGAGYHPPVGAPPNGAAGKHGHAVALARLPRQRRPGMIALAMALIGAGIVASTAVFSATNHREPVLVVEADVPAGAIIGAADLGTAGLSADPGVQFIPAAQLRRVVGHVAGTALHPGMLLTPAELAITRPPRYGQVLVPLQVRPSALPASGLEPGDRVLIVATPGDQGQPGSGNSAVLGVPVAGAVEAVAAAGTDGFAVVDVLVPTKTGVSLAAQASTGQFAVIVTRRAPT